MAGYENIVDNLDLPDDMWEKAVCPLCGGKDIAGQRFGMGPADLIANEDSIPTILPVAYLAQYTLCPCGMMYMNPRMTPEVYAAFYTSGTYDRITGRDVTGETNNQKIRAERIMRLILETVEKPPIMAMDIGASKGTLLDKIKEQYNCKTVGVDPHPLGETQHEWFDTLDDVDLKGRKCDVITMIHTLEHFYDPVGVLEQVRGHLHKNGFLFIEVPNGITDPAAFRITHPIAFEANSLVTVIQKAGYDIEDFAPAGKMLMAVAVMKA